MQTQDIIQIVLPIIMLVLGIAAGYTQKGINQAANAVVDTIEKLPPNIREIIAKDVDCFIDVIHQRLLKDEYVGGNQAVTRVILEAKNEIKTGNIEFGAGYNQQQGANLGVKGKIEF